MASKKDTKGVYSKVDLTLSKRYPDVAKSRKLLKVSALLGASVLVVSFGLWWTPFMFSNRPLSQVHHSFASECQQCHDAGRGVPEAKCLDCHQKSSMDLNLTAHFQATIPAQHPAQRDAERCIACHVEHRGHAANPLMVESRACAACHGFEALQGHPRPTFEADFQEKPGLFFTHARHVQEWMKRDGNPDLDASCGHCHQADGDGMGFAPISFERDCALCHLTGTDQSQPLPIASSENTFGVLDLAQLRTSYLAKSEWSLSANPLDFRVDPDGNLTKLGVEHRDPFIMSNLRYLRTLLFPEPNLVGLSDVNHPIQDQKTVIAELEAQIQRLRSEPNRQVQAELDQLESLLAQIRSQQGPKLENENQQPQGELLQRVEAVVRPLTEACRVCHLLENAAFLPVQSDQKTWRVGAFNHAEHEIQKACSACHQRVDFYSPDHQGETEQDRATILNLPSLESCSECHGQKVEDTCVTCHLFHPRQIHVEAPE